MTRPSIEPAIIILVKHNKEITMFDVSKNSTGYIFVNLNQQEFTFDFDPTDKTKKIAKVIRTEREEAK